MVNNLYISYLKDELLLNCSVPFASPLAISIEVKSIDYYRHCFPTLPIPFCSVLCIHIEDGNFVYRFEICRIVFPANLNANVLTRNCIIHNLDGGRYTIMLNPYYYPFPSRSSTLRQRERIALLFYQKRISYFLLYSLESTSTLRHFFRSSLKNKCQFCRFNKQREGYITTIIR